MSADGAATPPPPPPPGGHRIPIAIEEEMKSAFMDYAMSVIVSRALPDARDGLKPVHRRILYTQHGLNNTWNRGYIKCARVVGDVLGKYHPHGDTAAYDALVRLAQDFAMRYMLIDGQGNFGSVDGDPPAAYRYTECRMRKIGGELLADIDKETVDFQPNYDDREQEPTVLPARFPNLLVNGAAGIAVGMATNIPPHNLKEIVDATIALIKKPDITTDELIEIVPGPDFPTGGFIFGRNGIRQAYEHGRGAILMRGRTTIEEHPKTGRKSIVATEIPYQVNKSRLIEKIAELVRDKKIEGIADMRDESRPRRHAHRRRPEEGRRPGGRPEQPLEDDAAAGVVRHQHAGDRRGTPAAPVAEAGAHALHRPPARRRHAADAVRSARGARSDAHPRGVEDRRRQHRRGHRSHPIVEGHRHRQDGPDAELRPVAAAGAGDPRHAARQADRPGTRSAARRDQGGRRADRPARGHPVAPSRT